MVVARRSSGPDVLVGTPGNDKLSGGKGNDKLFGADGNDRLDGGKGNDFLDGGAGKDVLIGGKGSDVLLGGTGNDVLYGDTGKSGGHGWGHFLGWKPQSAYDDYLDGGAGNDKLFAGRGDDVLVYSMAGNLGAGFENVGAHDEYDGGTGSDTLVLQFTYGEAQLASVQQDIAAFQDFLAHRANPHGDNGREFEFKSFNLDVRNFEALQVQLVNTAPNARADVGATNEDTPLVVAGPGVLANDSDPDHLDVLSVVAGSTTSANGAAVVLSANGGYTYDPSGALELQKLGAGQTTADTFSYTIKDLGGATATATVQVTITGVNDAPVANPDSFATDEDVALSGNVLGNDTDVDSPTLSATLVSGPAHGALVFNTDGSFTYTSNANYFGPDGFTYKASDGSLDSNVSTVSLTVNPVNDAPVANADSFATDEDIALSGNVLGNDTDVDSPTLSATLVSGTAHGSVTLNPDGSFTYTPNANYFGSDSFGYKASDGALDFERDDGQPDRQPGQRRAGREPGQLCHRRRHRAERQRARQRHGRRQRRAQRHAGERHSARLRHTEPRRLVHVRAERELLRPRWLYLQG